MFSKRFILGLAVFMFGMWIVQTDIGLATYEREDENIKNNLIMDKKKAKR